MPHMLVLNRNLVLRSTLGHSIGFKKGQPTHVPDALYNDAIALGAVHEDGSAPDLGDGGEVTTPPNTPVDATARAAALTDALELIAQANQRDDFTAAGVPAVDAVSRLLGWKVSAREIAEEWTKRSARGTENQGE